MAEEAYEEVLVGLEAKRAERYAGWDSPEAQSMLGSDLDAITARVLAEDINPEPQSGRQEMLENILRPRIFKNHRKIETN